MDILAGIDEIDEDEGYSPDVSYSDNLNALINTESELSEDEARQITDAIRSTATATYILISRAHEMKAHKALGYATWADYVRGEFEFSPQRSYQLLDLNKTVKEIEAAAPDGTQIKLTEAQARDIKRELPVITEQIRTETESLTPEQAEAVVDRIISENREQMKEDAKVIAQKEKEYQEAQEEEHRRSLEAAADTILENDQPIFNSDEPTPYSPHDTYDNDIEVQVEGGGGLSPKEASALRSCIESLTHINSMDDPEIFVENVPEAKAQEIYDMASDAASWMNRFVILLETTYDL